jgi:hypothetical protein
VVDALPVPVKDPSPKRLLIAEDFDEADHMGSKDLPVRFLLCESQSAVAIAMGIAASGECYSSPHAGLRFEVAKSPEGLILAKLILHDIEGLAELKGAMGTA